MCRIKMVIGYVALAFALGILCSAILTTGMVVVVLSVCVAVMAIMACFDR